MTDDQANEILKQQAEEQEAKAREAEEAMEAAAMEKLLKKDKTSVADDLISADDINIFGK